MSDLVFIVAVSGCSGAGKTRLIERTVTLLGNAARLHFDDYRSVSSYPPDLKAWLDQGADLDEWRTPQLAIDLGKLRSGERVHLPQDLGIVEPAEFVVVEEPFGKSRHETARFVDFAAHLLVPADILLARRLQRRLEEEHHLFGEELPGQIHRDLHEYLATGRDLDAYNSDTVRQFADLVLDGMQPVDKLAEQLVAEILRRRTER